MLGTSEKQWQQVWPAYRFSFDKPEVHISTPAQALGKLCRYRGSCKFFYSVAQHAFYMAFEAMHVDDDPILAYLCLHHDDNECILADPPSPLKTSDDLVREDIVQQAFWDMLGVQDEWLDRYWARVKMMDNLIKYNEGWALQPDAIDMWPNQFLPGLKTLNANPIRPWSVDTGQAEAMWSIYHNSLVDVLVSRGWLEFNQVPKVQMYDYETEEMGFEVPGTSQAGR